MMVTSVVFGPLYYLSQLILIIIGNFPEIIINLGSVLFQKLLKPVGAQIFCYLVVVLLIKHTVLFNNDNNR